MGRSPSRSKGSGWSMRRRLQGLEPGVRRAWEGREERGCLGTSGDGNGTCVVRDCLHPTPLPAATRATLCTSTSCSPLHPSPKLDAGVVPTGSLQAMMSGRAEDEACVHLLSPFSRVHQEPRGAKAAFLCLSVQHLVRWGLGVLKVSQGSSGGEEGCQ